MILSVDFSTEYIHMLQARQRGRRLEITGFARMETPDGCVKNGIVTDAAALGDALARLRREGGFSARRVRFAAASPLISFHELTVPAVKPRELARLLAEETNQLAPSKKESLMDYVVLEQLEQEGRPFCRVWCAIIPRPLVEGYQEAARYAGLRPDGFDVAANAACKAYLLDDGIPKSDTAVYAGVRADELCLNLFDGTAGRFCRDLPIAAAKRPAENEYILSSMVSAGPSDEEARREEVIRMVTGQLSKLVQFQLMRDRHKPVMFICLCSDLAADERLAAAVEENLQIATAAPAAPDYLRSPEGFDYSEYLYAVGAAIRI